MPTSPLPHPRSERLRARTATEVVDAGFAALRQYPGLLLGTGLIFLLPVTLAVAALGEGGPTPGLVNSGSWPAGVASVLGFSLASSLMGLPLARAVAQVAAGQRPRWRISYRLGARTWSAAVLLWAVLSVARLAALLMAVFPVLAVSVLGMMASPVLALEGQGPGRSLRRSLALGGRGFGRGLGIVIQQLVVGVVVSASIGFLPLLGVLAVRDRWQRPLADLLQLAVGVLLCPPAAWTASLFYLDERVRREGLDLQVQLDEWDRDPGEPTSPSQRGERSVGSAR